MIGENHDCTLDILQWFLNARIKESGDGRSKVVSSHSDTNFPPPKTGGSLMAEQKYEGKFVYKIRKQKKHSKMTYRHKVNL